MRVLLIAIIGLFSFATTTGCADSKRQAEQGANLLEQTSQAFTQIAESSMPATVFIKAHVVASEQQPPSSLDLFGDDFFRKFFGQPFNPGQSQPQLARGSGFFINADGYIVTNNHVVKDATQITVLLNDGREFPAIVKGSDPRTDLAVLKIDAKELPFLKFGDSDALKVGEWVIAIGNPFGLEATLTVGVVSAKGRQDLGVASYEDFIQTDAAINPGNSGGPLLNLEGEVIGINTAIFSGNGGYMGIGLAIPSLMAQNVISQIVDSGTVKRAYLGVVLQPVDKELADALNLPKQEGIFVSEVIKDSPADKAGLKQGDVILQYNDKPVKTVNKFRNDIALMNSGTELKLKILRNLKPMTLKATLAAQDDEGVASSERLQTIGIDVEELTPEMASRLGLGPEIDGIVITKVKPGSPAAIAGLRPSFLITGSVVGNNQKLIKNKADLEASLKELGEKKHLILIIRYQNFQRFYTIRLTQ